MLVTVVGPTGIGRTTTIRGLSRLAGYDCLSVVTTRPSRLADDRVTVDRMTFDRMAKERLFAFTNEVHGNLYGTPLSASYALKRPMPIALIDYPIERVAEVLTADTYGVVVVLQPQNANTLYESLVARGHSDRVPDAAQQYAQCCDLVDRADQLCARSSELIVVRADTLGSANTLGHLVEQIAHCVARLSPSR